MDSTSKAKISSSLKRRTPIRKKTDRQSLPTSRKSLTDEEDNGKEEKPVRLQLHRHSDQFLTSHYLSLKRIREQQEYVYILEDSGRGKITSGDAERFHDDTYCVDKWWEGGAVVRELDRRTIGDDIVDGRRASILKNNDDGDAIFSNKDDQYRSDGRSLTVAPPLPPRPSNRFVNADVFEPPQRCDSKSPQQKPDSPPSSARRTRLPSHEKWTDQYLKASSVGDIDKVGRLASLSNKAQQTSTNDVTKSDVTKSDVTKSDVAKSDVTKSDVAKSDVTKSDVTKSESTNSLSVGDVLRVLESMNMRQYADSFSHAQVDGYLLGYLDDQMLENDLKMLKFHRLKLRAYFERGWRPKV